MTKHRSAKIANDNARSVLRGLAQTGCAIALAVLACPAYSQITEPKAKVVNMNTLDEAMISEGCIMTRQHSQPMGCTVNPERAMILKGITTDTVRLQHMEMAKGSKSPNHNHPDEEVFYVLEGEIRVVGGADTYVLQPGDVFVVPSYMTHEFEALQESVFVEVGGPGPLLYWPALKKMGGQLDLEMKK